MKVEKEMATHSSTLAWKIPWTEEPGGLQSMGSHRVEHKWLHFHFSLSCIGEGNGNPLQCSCLENPRDRGAWRATVHGVAKSWTWQNDGHTTKLFVTNSILYYLIFSALVDFLFYVYCHFVDISILWPPDGKNWLIWKDPDAGKD